MNPAECPTHWAHTVVIVETALPAHLELSHHFKVVVCPPVFSELEGLCANSLPCIVLAEEAFIRSFPQRFHQRLRRYGNQILLLAISSPSASYVGELLEFGCAGVVAKDITVKELTRAMDAMIRGEFWFPRIVMSDILRRVLPKFEAHRLTPREKEVLIMIADGHSNDAIAKALFISRETVRWHQRSLYSKVGTSDRRQLAAMWKADSQDKT